MWFVFPVLWGSEKSVGDFVFQLAKHTDLSPCLKEGGGLRYISSSDRNTLTTIESLIKNCDLSDDPNCRLLCVTFYLFKRCANSC